MNITLAQAESVIAAAKEAAEERGEKVSLAVVDSGGNCSTWTGLTLAGPRSFVPYGGGVVIKAGDELIGALGVSGAPSSGTDHEIAVAAADRASVVGRVAV